MTNIPDRLYGITVDGSWTGTEKLNQIIEAIKAMSVKPTIRIEMKTQSIPNSTERKFRRYQQFYTTYRVNRQKEW